MKFTKADGTQVDVPDDVVAAIRTNTPPKGPRMDVEALAKKYPWAAETLALHGLHDVDNGRGGIKQATYVRCQAGNGKVLTTSKFRGIDSVVCERIGPTPVAKLVAYNFSALTIDPETKKPTGCKEIFEAATSDLFQTFLCPTHKAENKAHAEALRKVIRDQAAQNIALLPEE